MKTPSIANSTPLGKDLQYRPPPSGPRLPNPAAVPAATRTPSKGMKSVTNLLDEYIWLTNPAFPRYLALAALPPSSPEVLLPWLSTAPTEVLPVSRSRDLVCMRDRSRRICRESWLRAASPGRLHCGRSVGACHRNRWIRPHLQSLSAIRARPGMSRLPTPFHDSGGQQ